MDIKEWLPQFSVSAETDKDLQEYFFHTPEINKIIESDHWLVLGRKGTGKTAIYKYLDSAEPNTINDFHTISLNFKDYPWPAHKLYKESLAGELTAYQKSWKFLFIVKLISKLIEVKEANSEILSKELKWAKKYIQKVFGNPDPTLIEVLFSKLSRIKKIKGPGLDLDDIDFNVGEVSFDDVAESKELQTSLRTNAFVLLQYFESIYLKNAGTHKFIILIDQLDENWLADEIEEYSKILINLINVCRNISIENGYSQNVKVIPFLRTDIYDSLRFNDKNKLLQDSAIVISWDNESLDNMFFERIKKYKPEEVGLIMSRKSGSIFEVEFVRQGTPPFNFITRRSFFRPRDVITYFNKIRTSVYNEIIDEWSNQFPNIERLLSVLQIISVETFNYAEYQSKYQSEFPNSSEGEIRRDLNFLFNNSIIGQKKQGRWEYLSSLQNLKLNIEKDFRTHQSLKYRLQLVESRTAQK
jgi:hypothetical protein